MTDNLRLFFARLLGLCNNYAYVIMLSAAHDILSDDKNNVSRHILFAKALHDRDYNNCYLQPQKTDVFL